VVEMSDRDVEIGSHSFRKEELRGGLLTSLLKIEDRFASGVGYFWRKQQRA